MALLSASSHNQSLCCSQPCASRSVSAPRATFPLRKACAGARNGCIAQSGKKWQWQETDGGDTGPGPQTLPPNANLIDRALKKWDVSSKSSWEPFSGSTIMAAAGAGLGGFSIDGPVSSLQSIGVLALIIAVHECGHFQAARLQGIHVTKFAIGFGPVLWDYKSDDGVEYSLRLFPLGGYVAFPGEERPENPNASEEEKAAIAKEAEGRIKYESDDPNLLKNRSIVQRGIVISAGVAANFVFAYLTLLSQVGDYKVVGTPQQVGDVVQKIRTSANKQLDFLVQRDGAIVMLHSNVVQKRWTRANMQLDSMVQRNGAIVTLHSNVVQKRWTRANKQFDSMVQRDGAIMPAIPVADMDTGNRCSVADLDTGDGRIGVRLTSNLKFDHLHPKSVSETFKVTTSEFNRLFNTVYRGLSNIFSNFSQASKQLTGPVAIVAAGSDILRTDAAGIFQFCGYLAFLLIEAIRGGRKVPDEVEGAVMSSGLLLLLGSGLFLAVRDTMNLVL
eukprot:gene590-2012_t